MPIKTILGIVVFGPLVAMLVLGGVGALVYGFRSIWAEGGLTMAILVFWISGSVAVLPFLSAQTDHARTH